MGIFLSLQIDHCYVKNVAMKDEFTNADENKCGNATQESINKLIEQLPEALESGHGAAFDWFMSYVDSLELAGKYGRFDEVASLCEGAGYSADYKFDGNEGYCDMADVVARSIIANAISCMKEGDLPSSLIKEQVDVYHQEVAYQKKHGDDGSTPKIEA